MFCMHYGQYLMPHHFYFHLVVRLIVAIWFVKASQATVKNRIWGSDVYSIVIIILQLTHELLNHKTTNHSHLNVFIVKVPPQKPKHDFTAAYTRQADLQYHPHTHTHTDTRTHTYRVNEGICSHQSCAHYIDWWRSSQFKWGCLLRFPSQADL